MPILRFEWDEGNEDHISRHGVAPSETEEVLRRPHVEQRGARGLRLAWGQSLDGRHLVVVFSPRGRGVARVITARDMSRREKELYRRRKGP